MAPEMVTLDPSGLFELLDLRDFGPISREGHIALLP
jgi:hypothetical protein